MKQLTFKQINELYHKSYDIVENLAKKKTNIKLPVYLAYYGPDMDVKFSLRAIYKITNVNYEKISSKYSTLPPIYDAYAEGIVVTYNNINHFKNQYLYDCDLFGGGKGCEYDFLVLSNEKDFKEMCAKTIKKQKSKLDKISKQL